MTFNEPPSTHSSRPFLRRHDIRTCVYIFVVSVCVVQIDTGSGGVYCTSTCGFGCCEREECVCELQGDILFTSSPTTLARARTNTTRRRMGRINLDTLGGDPPNLEFDAAPDAKVGLFALLLLLLHCIKHARLRVPGLIRERERRSVSALWGLKSGRREGGEECQVGITLLLRDANGFPCVTVVGEWREMGKRRRGEQQTHCSSEEARDQINNANKEHFVLRGGEILLAGGPSSTGSLCVCCWGRVFRSIAKAS